MKRRWPQRLLAAGTAFPAVLIGCNAGIAQVDPGVINPGVQQRENLPPLPLPQPQQGPLKPLIREAPEQETPSTDDQQRLQIKDIEIEGNTAIPTEELRPFIADLLKQPVSFQEIQTAVEGITSLYRSRGFLLSQALLPKQSLEGGILRIQVIEGFIESIDVQPGDTPFSRWLTGYMRPVLNQAPIKLGRLERQILLAQSISGLSVESVLSPGKQTGGSVLTLNTTRDRSSASLGVDNWVPAQLGDWRGTLTLAANPFAAGHPWALGLIGSTTWPNGSGLDNGVFTTAVPLNSSGLLASGSFSYTQSNSINLNTSGSPDQLKTRGESWYGSLALRYPLLLTRRSSAFVSLQADAQNSYSDLYLNSDLIQNNSIDRLRAIRLRIDGAWAGSAWASQASVVLAQGLPIWGGDNGPDPVAELSNPYGSVSFTTLRLSLGHQRRLGPLGSPWQLSLRGEGQVSGTPLPSSEQLAYGGPSYGKAFHSVYTLGDQGAMAGLELAYSTPDWKGLQAQPYLFADLGYTMLKRTEPSFPSSQTVSTYGAGLRLYSVNSNWLSLDTGWGLPASNTVQPAQTGLRNSIVFARATLSF